MVAGSAAVGGGVRPPLQGWRRESSGEQAASWEGRGMKCKLLESGLMPVPGAPCWLFKGVWRCLSNRNGLAQVPRGNLSHLSLGLNFHEYVWVRACLAFWAEIALIVDS